MRAHTFLATLGVLASIAAGCGGNTSTANGGGDGGDGRDGGNPTGCPVTVPSAQDSCNSPGLQCTYGCNVVATCSAQSWQIAQSNMSCPQGDAGPPSDGGAGCASDKQCTNGFECSPGGVTVGCGICEMPQNPCSSDSDCAMIGDAAPSQPMVCGPGGECTCPVGGKTGSCIPACTSASGCGPDEACASGHCVAKPCTSDSECPSTQSVDYACQSGVCATKSCSTNADCGAHYCVNGTCYPQAGVCTAPAA